MILLIIFLVLEVIPCIGSILALKYLNKDYIERRDEWVIKYCFVPIFNWVIIIALIYKECKESPNPKSFAEWINTGKY